jgi:hypothetical protein
MGAIFSALAEWLGPFLISLASFATANIWTQFGAILGVGFATFAGLDTLLNMFTSYVAHASQFTGLIAAFWHLMGFNTAISILVGAVTARVAILKAKVVLRATGA